MLWNIDTIIEAKKQSKRLEEIKTVLLNTRGLIDEDDVVQFYNPPHPISIEVEDTGIDAKQLKLAADRIRAAIKNGESMLIFGDYDADGITATALLWETIYKMRGKITPFIPDRLTHGYGLSEAGIVSALETMEESPAIVITVDNGIVAHEAADYLRDEGIELILTDHHQLGKSLPVHNYLVHSTKIAGSAVAWFLARELSKDLAESTLELAAIGTVADIMPMLGVNRSIVKHGLINLQQTQRPGLKALYKEAGIDEVEEFGTYHIGYIIGPRINAMGRLKSAMDSLRLLCTQKDERAESLTLLLNTTNTKRQDLTQEYIDLAENQIGDIENEKLIVVKHKDFHEGVVGLVAGKLAERYSKPAIVISIDENDAKASARSVRGVNIIELIRRFDHHLINAGGHPLAAGFSMESSKIEEFVTDIQKYARENIEPELLVPSLEIECQIALHDVDYDLLDLLEEFKPFGMKNSQPLFCIDGARVVDYRIVGRDKRHLKVVIQDEFGNKKHAIGFGLAAKAEVIEKDPVVSVAFEVVENLWNGKRLVQMQLKDVVSSI